MDDLWSKLVRANDESAPRNSLDHGLALGSDFEGVRGLTEKGRAAKALPLPVASGTRVSFFGNVGAILTYEQPPAHGAIGEVVTVRSASGDITAHDGMVFVKWASGEFLPVHAEHLRAAPAPAEKKARVIHGDPSSILGHIPSGVNRIRVAGLGDLTSFLKVSSNTLVHKSTKDLWAFNKDADGGILVERLFDGSGRPLKD